MHVAIETRRTISIGLVDFFLEVPLFSIMRIYVRSDDGVCSDWLEVKKRSRQGCVLSPLLFNIFFAAVPTVFVLHRFNGDDTVILAELVHVKARPTPMGPEPGID